MPDLTDLIERSRQFAENFDPVHIPIEPSRKLAIVTCMDSRIDVFDILGLKLGEAHVIRNAGGIVTDDVIRSLVISQRRLETTQIILIQHTDCGLQKIDDDAFRKEIQEATGVAPEFAIESFRDLDANVLQSVERLRSSPFLANSDDIYGFVYDVDSGRLRPVGQS